MTVPPVEVQYPKAFVCWRIECMIRPILKNVRYAFRTLRQSPRLLWQQSSPSALPLAPTPRSSASLVGPAPAFRCQNLLPNFDGQSLRLRAHSTSQATDYS